ncbi:hypothetical protein K4R79_10435 [Staphylococcus epidermidis]|nr:hypothetical protein [Staphylococcus epidermidis]MBF9284112.1 hypothetical protein [Staphylococcus epidermidis]MBF9306722.1 hypothetical protein [Staphylococcus epidermidis]MCG1808613.1 hypothetical protein [Staphylococcus epidermidis]
MDLTAIGGSAVAGAAIPIPVVGTVVGAGAGILAVIVSDAVFKFSI